MKSLNRFHRQFGSELEIAELAHNFRVKLGIANDSYIKIIDILEFEICKFIPEFRLIVKRDIELDTTAATTIDPPRIYVRETVYDAACDGDHDSRSILAHELGHLLMHVDIDGAMQKNYLGYSDQIKGMNLTESSEDQADVFARNFLVPVYIAFRKRSHIDELSSSTGTSRKLARTAVTISKRQEMLVLRSYSG